MLLQQVEVEYGLPVVSIVRLQHLVSFVKSDAAAADIAGNKSSTSSSCSTDSVELNSNWVRVQADIEAYRAQYGVEY